MFIILFLTIGQHAAYGSEGIVIMRMSYQENKRADTAFYDEYENAVSVDIGQYLKPYYRIFIDSTLSQNRDTGITRADAEEALSNYPANFVLYGSIANEFDYLHGRMELYDKRNNSVEYFYASDGIDEYDRLIETLCNHILAWFHTETDKLDAMLSDIEELRQQLKEIKTETEQKRIEPRSSKDEESEEPLKEITLQIPVRVGYWSYTKTNWVERIQGTVEASVGVEFIPELQFAPINNMRQELSINLFAGYRYGLNAGEDILRLHNIVVNPGITYRLNVYSNNWMLLGIGALFEFGLWHIEEPEYGTVMNYQQSLTGISALLGYSYRISKMFTVDVGANLYFYFSQGASPVIRPYVGTSIIIMGGKYSARK
jgi:hypothetical protein